MEDLEDYKNGYQDIIEVLDGIGPEKIRCKSSPDSWSIHEILVHLADTEIQSHVRMRTILADIPAIIMNHNEMAWSVVLRYRETGIDDALTIIKLMRRVNYKLLSTLENSEWEKQGIHSVRGIFSLQKCVSEYTEHLHQHIAQIQRNLKAFKQ